MSTSGNKIQIPRMGDSSKNCLLCLFINDPVGCKKEIIIKFGTSILNPGAGFLRIFTVAFDRLGYVRLV